MSKKNGGGSKQTNLKQPEVPKPRPSQEQVGYSPRTDPGGETKGGSK